MRPSMSFMPRPASATAACAAWARISSSVKPLASPRPAVPIPITATEALMSLSFMLRTTHSHKQNAAFFSAVVEPRGNTGAYRQALIVVLSSAAHDTHAFVQIHQQYQWPLAIPGEDPAHRINRAQAGRCAPPQLRRLAMRTILTRVKNP